MDDTIDTKNKGRNRKALSSLPCPDNRHICKLETWHQYKSRYLNANDRSGSNSNNINHQYLSNFIASTHLSSQKSYTIGYAQLLFHFTDQESEAENLINVR